MRILVGDHILLMASQPPTKKATGRKLRSHGERGCLVGDGVNTTTEDIGKKRGRFPTVNVTDQENQSRPERGERLQLIVRDTSEEPLLNLCLLLFLMEGMGERN